MDEDRARFLAEWYGAGEAETSAEQADPAGTGYISSQIPPSRPGGSGYIDANPVTLYDHTIKTIQLL